MAANRRGVRTESRDCDKLRLFPRVASPYRHRGTQQLLDLVLHLDKHLNAYTADLGHWLHAILFLITFAETGLVVTPFLPGDSLLLAVRALSATEGSPFQLPLIGPLLIVAAILGDAVNYSFGRYVGPRVFSREKSLLLNNKHLLRAHSA